MSEERESESKAKKITSLLSISHDKDVDGLASAAIVWRYAKAKGLDFKATLTDYGSFEQVFSSIAKQRDTLIIITDLGMPKMNGIELSKQILEKKAGVPILLCTGFSEGITQETLLDIGIHAMVMKPMITTEMADIVHSATSQNR